MLKKRASITFSTSSKKRDDNNKVRFSPQKSSLRLTSGVFRDIFVNMNDLKSHFSPQFPPPIEKGLHEMKGGSLFNIIFASCDKSR